MLKASKHEAIFKIRFPLRVVEDYYVDRLQVYNRNVEPSNTNCPIAFLCLPRPLPGGEKDEGNNLLRTKFLFLTMSNLYRTGFFKSPKGDLGGWSENNLGGYSIGVPPLPIPNREVKPNHVDGTA